MAQNANPRPGVLERSELPEALTQNPACGACGNETRHKDHRYICEECQLTFDTDGMNASFIDPRTPTCGEHCNNYWHGDDKIKIGWGYKCGTCTLPATHTSTHWTNCQAVRMDGRMNERPNPDISWDHEPPHTGELDDFYATNIESVHFEAIDECRWYANIYMRDGQLWTLSFGSTSGRARGYANAERVQ